MRQIEQAIGYTFKDKSLLKLALTHSSYTASVQNGHLLCNERLEFLGDSILGFTVAEFLYRNYPDRPEGTLSRLRADLVCEKNLAEVAAEFQLGASLNMGKGERQNGGALRKSVTSDAVEALIAAVFLDGGFEEAKNLIYRLILSRPIPETPAESDYKTRLQEFIQREKGHVLEYRVLREEGPDHDRRFVSGVYLDEKQIGEGEGTSKKRSEQAAACAALKALNAD